MFKRNLEKIRSFPGLRNKNPLKHLTMSELTVQGCFRQLSGKTAIFLSEGGGRGPEKIKNSAIQVVARTVGETLSVRREFVFPLR